MSDEPVQRPYPLGASDDTPRIVHCAGRPWCDLEGDAAFDYAMKGCPWCTITWCYPSGIELIERPGNA